MTATQTPDQLRAKKCVPCEGGVPKLTPSEAADQVRQVPGWDLSRNGERIRKTWVLKNFMAAIRFFEKVAAVAEAEGHHPDLHVEQYRNVAIEIWTHAIGGLSENDFILAAKIDQIPVELKKT
jgi:4a-hydroxytetrahydrobiopterin dehydratase